MKLETYLSAYGEACKDIGHYGAVLDDSRLRRTQDGMAAFQKLHKRMRLSGKLKEKIVNMYEFERKCLYDLLLK